MSPIKMVYWKGKLTEGYELTGRMAIGPVGKNRCQATMLSVG
jgi:hypothetical protein